MVMKQSMPLRSRNIFIRFLALIPVVLAVGIWAGHHTLKSELLERHPDFPISLSTFIALMPECPQPVVSRNPAPFVLLPDEELPYRVYSSPIACRLPARGPPLIS